MLEFLFNKVTSLQACNFIKNWLQHKYFSVKFAKSLRASFLQNISGGCFWKYLIISVFIAYENDESCHFVVRLCSTALISFYCVCFLSSISFFYSHFMVDLIHHLHYWYIIFDTSFINGYIINALKKSSRRKEMRIKKEKVEVFQQIRYSRKEAGKWKIGTMKFLVFTLYLVTRITLTLISSPAIIGCFPKVNFQGIDLVIWNFESSAFMWVIQKIGCFMWKYSVLVKIRESLLCVTNRCIKVTSKLILPSVSRFKFCPYYKSRVKLIFI